MTDARLAPSILTHPTIEELSDAAHRVFVNAIVYAVDHGTDGFISPRALRLLHPQGAQQPAIDELVGKGLWTPERDGHRIRSFLKYQTSAEQVEKAKELARARKAKQRAKRQDDEARKLGLPRDATRDATQDGPRDGRRGPPRTGQLTETGLTEEEPPTEVGDSEEPWLSIVGGAT